MLLWPDFGGGAGRHALDIPAATANFDVSHSPQYLRFRDKIHRTWGATASTIRCPGHKTY